jgi:hypothetical protein
MPAVALAPIDADAVSDAPTPIEAEALAPADTDIPADSEALAPTDRPADTPAEAPPPAPLALLRSFTLKRKVFSSSLATASVLHPQRAVAPAGQGQHDELQRLGGRHADVSQQ